MCIQMEPQYSRTYEHSHERHSKLDHNCQICQPAIRKLNCFESHPGIYISIVFAFFHCRFLFWHVNTRVSRTLASLYTTQIGFCLVCTFASTQFPFVHIKKRNIIWNMVWLSPVNDLHTTMVLQMFGLYTQRFSLKCTQNDTCGMWMLRKWKTQPL